MKFPYFPKHDSGCGHPDCCPHAGGASIATLVRLAQENTEQLASLQRTIDAERKRSSALLSELEDLRYQLSQAKLELKLERQNKFATNEQRSSSQDQAALQADASQERVCGKRGAPVGHPGWFRPTPLAYDWVINVGAPSKCPDCHSGVVIAESDPQEHLQEDIIDGQYRVVLYRHVAARCPQCDVFVQKAGKGEILNSRIGPGLRSKAVYLRNVIGISYRKVPRAIEEMFGVCFTPAALIGFEEALSELAEPVVDDIAKKLSSSDGAVHADETFWTLDGERSYFWVHGDSKFIHFQFDISRAGEISRDLLGSDFTGTLVTDCYSGYHSHVAGAKQKCLAHLARTARDWQKLTDPGTVDYQFFEDVKQFVKRACKFDRVRKAKRGRIKKQSAEIDWLRSELERLSLTDVKHEKSVTLQGRILRHLGEWLVFVDDPRVSPTNNLAERALRPLVVLRKVTFGSRSHQGAERMAALMSVAETARRHGHRPSDIYFELYTRPPDRVLRNLYAGA
jgi:transposase